MTALKVPIERTATALQYFRSSRHDPSERDVLLVTLDDDTLISFFVDPKADPYRVTVDPQPLSVLEADGTYRTVTFEEAVAALGLRTCGILNSLAHVTGRGFFTSLVSLLRDRTRQTVFTQMRRGCARALDPHLAECEDTLTEMDEQLRFLRIRFEKRALFER